MLNTKSNDLRIRWKNGQSWSVKSKQSKHLNSLEKSYRTSPLIGRVVLMCYDAANAQQSPIAHKFLITQRRNKAFKGNQVFSRVHATLHPALSVGRSVGLSVTLYFFCDFFWTSLLLLKWSSDLKYGPSPPARDFGSRVSGLVSINNSNYHMKFFVVPINVPSYKS